jgi:hypothetical protein
MNFGNNPKMDYDKNYSEYLSILIESIFFAKTHKLGKTLPPSKIGEPCQRTYMDPFHKNLFGYTSP